jgi:hypothetical protein
MVSPCAATGRGDCNRAWARRCELDDRALQRATHLNKAIGDGEQTQVGQDNATAAPTRRSRALRHDHPRRLCSTGQEISVATGWPLHVLLPP